MKKTHDLDYAETARTLTLQQTKAHKGSWKSHIHPAEKAHGDTNGLLELWWKIDVLPPVEDTVPPL